MEIAHKEPLLEAARDGKLWQLWYTSIPSEKTIDTYIQNALQEQAAGKSVPFVVRNKANNQLIGTTRYCNIEATNRRLEIGYTWYAKSYQKTGVNKECKYLLLKNAFEELNAIAVEFRTHWHNQASRTAILKLGAKQDGILRSHRIDSDGALRDTVVFSIIENEWQTVKKSLEFQIHKYDH